MQGTLEGWDITKTLDTIRNVSINKCNNICAKLHILVIARKKSNVNRSSSTTDRWERIGMRESRA